MRIDGNDIYMTRGDTEFIEVSLSDDDGNEIPLKNGDTIYMTVKKGILYDKVEFQKIVKEFKNGTALITIDPEDTKGMDFGNFVYDIQLTSRDGVVTTIVKPSGFIVEGEVTDD